MSTTMAPHVVAACNQEQRLAALRRYGILDTPREPAFDDITRLVAHVCQTPIALVSFVDAHRQWFKSELGLGVRETPLGMSMCAHAILERDLLVVPDALADERFRTMPVVASHPHLRFYAGARLVSPDGQPLGTLCVLDYVPRTPTPAQLDALRALARQVVSQLELRRALADEVAAGRALLAARQEADAARQAAEQANRMKDEFLAALSHELRTPLAAILLWANVLRGRPSDPRQVEEGLETILLSARAQKKLIEDLLDTSRIAAGKLILRRRDVDLAAVVREAVEGVLPAAGEKGVAIGADAPGGAAVAWADADRLRQVVSNLLTNAVKFTPPGGRVRVALRARGGWAELEVADDGQGITAEFLPHIFEPFTQADDSGARAEGGLGLGLAIARKLVELHGGSISGASPGPGSGATFTVRLPLRRDDGGDEAGPDDDRAAPRSAPQRRGDAPAEAAGPPPPGLAGRRVLLAEDDPATRTALVQVLTRAGAEVVAVDSAAAALDAFARARPDLLLSDVGLPDLDGYGLVREVRRMEAATGGGPVPAGPRTPAVALTAYAGVRDHQLALEAGFDTHLPKPADADELIEVLANLLAAKVSYP